MSETSAETGARAMRHRVVTLVREGAEKTRRLVSHLNEDDQERKRQWWLASMLDAQADILQGLPLRVENELPPAAHEIWWRGKLVAQMSKWELIDAFLCLLQRIEEQHADLRKARRVR